jgi:hypothetical protein
MSKTLAVSNSKDSVKTPIHLVHIPSPEFNTSSPAKMKFSNTIIGSMLAATGVSAQQSIVKNNCQSTVVYVQSFPYDGSAPGTLTAVAPGQYFSEAFRSSGSVIFNYASLYESS